MSANVLAQDLPVTGTVIDDFGDPVLGANVVVKGTGIGATTDIDGNFSFNAPKGSTIVVSFIGYTSQEIIFDGKPINVTLKEDSELLEDVVVIGYGSVKKNDLTGSVVAIKAEDVNRGVVTSPDQMLKGKVPGLLVTLQHQVTLLKALQSVCVVQLHFTLAMTHLSLSMVCLLLLKVVLVWQTHWLQLTLTISRATLY